MNSSTPPRPTGSRKVEPGLRRPRLRLLPSLLAGATLISAPRDTFTDPAAFTDLIRAERVTLSLIPPAVLALLDPDELTGTALRAIACAGEALPAVQANRWSRPASSCTTPTDPPRPPSSSPTTSAPTTP